MVNLLPSSRHERREGLAKEVRKKIEKSRKVEEEDYGKRKRQGHGEGKSEKKERR